ncbi:MULTISPECIES: tripartite tricarboxylate transporter substrate binding protein [unclassified Polynucleobacter]|uniref:Bug family tripartite tricarboxylate transporter substrate binding protein n=1 Tax=unclassified Polynucleobacter TaxID=2640945 RepID=UPI0024932F2B|nr:MULTISPECIES: tripartite tricarboxylate transporter substrate binding protein [unclassified Polynucleobacter]
MKNLFRLTLLCFVALFSMSNIGYAQTNNWPNKVIKIVVPFAPGSFTDTAARVIGAEITKHTGQTVIIENKGGAGSTLGTDAVAKSAPDGYTFLLTDNSFAVSTALYEKLPYQPLKDITPVSLVADAPAVLVGRLNLPQKNLKEIVQAARSNPNGFNYGSGGIGSSAHLAMEAFLVQNNLKMTHIPFKGIASAIVDVVADRVDLAIGSVGSTAPFIRDGKLMGVAISGNQRHPLFPQVPTFAQAGFPNYKMTYWFGVLAPTGTPNDIIEKMHQEIVHAIQTPQVIEVFKNAGVNPTSNSPAEFSKMIRDESTMWSDIIKKSDIKANLN